jgi:parallel beta-helix repeat protein
MYEMGMHPLLRIVAIIIGSLASLAEIKSPFLLELREARVLLSGDLGGAIPVAELLKDSTSGTQPVIMTLSGPESTTGSSATLAANSTSSPALAPTLYVAPTGSNSNDGRSINTPFRTISQAGAVARAGDVVDIRGGIYNEYAVLKNSGTSSSRITFMAHPGERVVVDGSGKSPNMSSPWSVSPVIQVAGNYITLKDIEVRNAAADGVGVYGGNAILDHLYVHNTYLSGIRLWQAWDGLVQNSTIHDAYNYNTTSRSGGDADGISLSGDTGGRHTIRNNHIYNCSDDGIDTWKNVNNRIEGNIVHNSGRDQGNGNGFKLGPAGNNIVTRNVAYDNRSVGFDMNSGGGNQLYNNTAYRNTGANFISYSLANTFKNNISYTGSLQLDSRAVQSFNTWNLQITDPRFVSTDPNSRAFLRLASDSPSIDAGTNVGMSYSGDAPDLGAYEVTASAPASAPCPGSRC